MAVTETYPTRSAEIRARLDYPVVDADGHIQEMVPVLEDYVREIGLPSGGAIRVSLGLVSNFADVHRFIEFAGSFIDLTGVPDDLPPRLVC